MELQHFLYKQEGKVAVLTINRPDKLNALNDAVIAQLGDAAEAIATRQDVAGAIITGAGAKAFVAGADIAELARQGPLEAKTRSLRGQAVLRRFETCGTQRLLRLVGKGRALQDVA